MKSTIIMFVMAVVAVTGATVQAAGPESLDQAKVEYQAASRKLWDRYAADLAKVQQTYLRELTAAHADAVKRQNLSESQSILAAMKEIQDDLNATRTLPGDTTLRKGSRWLGTVTYQGKDSPSMLTITARSAERFKASLEWANEVTGHVVAEVEGGVKGDEVTFEMKKVLSGRKVLFPVTYTGRVVGRSLKGSTLDANKKIIYEFSYLRER